MAVGTRQTNTMEEGLRKLLPALTDLLLTEDADPDTIGAIQQVVIGKLREPIERAKQAGLTQSQPTAAPQTPMAGPMPMTPQPPQAPMAGGQMGGQMSSPRSMGGLMQGISISPDELNRILSSSNTGQ